MKKSKRADMVLGKDQHIIPISKGENWNCNDAVLFTVQGGENDGAIGYSSQWYQGGPSYRVIECEVEIEEIKERNKLLTLLTAAIRRLRESIRVEVTGKGRSRFPNHSVSALLEFCSECVGRTHTEHHSRTVYDCNGPSWSHTSWDVPTGTSTYTGEPGLEAYIEEVRLLASQLGID